MPARRTNEFKELIKPRPIYNKKIADFRDKIALPLIERMLSRRGTRRETHKSELLNVLINLYRKDEWKTKRIADLKERLERR